MANAMRASDELPQGPDVQQEEAHQGHGHALDRHPAGEPDDPEDRQLLKLLYALLNHLKRDSE